MTRSAGFRVADVDVGILNDPKVRALVRSTTDEALAARSLVAYLSVVTASWDRGERVALADAAPVWMTGLDDLAARLRDVGLLDPDGTIPERAWESWYGPARDRRELAREAGREGNRRRWHPNDGIATRSDTDGAPTGTRSPVRTVPYRSDTTVRPAARSHFDDASRSTCPRCGDLVDDHQDPKNAIVVDRYGGLGHRECPTLAAHLNGAA